MSSPSGDHPPVAAVAATAVPAPSPRRSRPLQPVEVLDSAPLHHVPAGTIPPSRRRRAMIFLLLTTTLWGLSFPLAKAVAAAQAGTLPAGASTWFLTAATLVFRFGLAGALLAALFWRALAGGIRRREVSQGVMLGFFCAAGMLLQIDGLNYTSASTAAFLTSCYVVIIPIIVAVQRRRFPPGLVVVSVGLVVVGMAILADVDFRNFRLGRGELENVGASLFFAAQIFWLERPIFQKNRTGPTSVVMFATVAGFNLPVLLATARGPGEIGAALAGSPAILAMLLGLTLLCTVCTFTLMNHWQREIEATEAGLIYCAEPVFTALLALFLPGLLAAWTGIHYPNEHLTIRILLGGGLITLASALIQLRPRAVTPVR